MAYLLEEDFKDRIVWRRFKLFFGGVMSSEEFLNWVHLVNEWVWGLPLIILLLGTGLVLTVRLVGVQFRYLLYGLKLAFLTRDDKSKGDVSHFEALMVALAGTLGIGNIVGVATAVATGGLGAIFWMWVTAIIGMSTKYAEAILAIRYRITDEKGEISGGPMYYLQNGLNMKPLAVLFSLFGAIAALGIGNTVQAHSVADAVKGLWGIDPWRTGTLLTFLTGFVVMGGIHSIGRVSAFMVPLMASLYILMGLTVILMNIAKLPDAFYTILSSAFNGQAAKGGFVGSGFLLAMRMGIARGFFSNEAGLGSAPIVAAAARTKHAGSQACVSMIATFCDTLVVCTITGLVIAVSGVLGDLDSEGNVLNGASMTMAAFERSIPGGGFMVTMAIIFFAYSTIIGWAYYGEKCIHYLFGFESTVVYRVLFTFLVLPGAALSLKVVWGIADITNGLMALPNLIGLIFLSGVVLKETKSFEAFVARGEITEEELKEQDKAAKEKEAKE